MTPKDFAKFLKRDGRCLHCGSEGDDLIPQHRLNRGSGGKNKKAERASNIIVFCSYANTLAESNAEFARVCRDRGWKLQSWQDPAAHAVQDFVSGEWYFLDDQFKRTPVNKA